MDRSLYPFTAVVGQKRARQTLLCLTVEPRVGGMLLYGEKGTVKSALVRTLSGLDGVHLLELPVSAMEDMPLGGVELEVAIRTGRRTLQPGLLARVDGAALYVDEVNLLPSALTATLLDTLKTGVCRVEQDGISHTHPARFALMSTMNPEEGTLHPQLLDRFGPYIAVMKERELEVQKEVVRRRLAFEERTVAFRAQWTRQEERLVGQLVAARVLLSQVDVRETEEQAACLLARQANAVRHRAELAIPHTICALAALAGRTYINLEDLHTAVELALPYRGQERSEGPPLRQERGEEFPQGSGMDGQAEGGDGSADKSHPANGPPQEEVQAPASPTEQESSQERLGQGEDLYKVGALFITRVDCLVRRGSGRRSKTRSATRRGRAVGDHIPRGKVEDLTVGATLRAAAPYQWSRDGGQSGLVILPLNLWVKVRENRVGVGVVFAVDASGSMGAAKRMKEAKEAVFSVLMGSYQEQDQAELAALRGGETAAVLEPTRSVEPAQRELQALPTGGRTPLAVGLEEARCILERQRRRVRDSLLPLVFITDGRASFSWGGDPVEEALRAAQRVAEAHILAVVIDIEWQFVSLGLTAQMAQVMGAPCCRVEELWARPLAQLVRGRSLVAG